MENIITPDVATNPVMGLGEGVGLMAIVMGLTGVLKLLKIPSRFLPLCALVLAIVGQGLMAGFSSTSIFTGIVVGLSASGLYSGSKATLGK